MTNIQKALRSLLLVGGSLALASVLSSCAPLRQARSDSLANQATTSAAISDATLDAKMKLQLDRYDAARQTLLDQVVTHQSLVTRADFEATVSLGSQDWTSDERAALAARHDRLIDAAYQRARQTSVLDLDKLRPNGQTAIRNFCTAIPKGGMLHIHPWGTLDETTAASLLNAVNPPVDFQELHHDLSTGGEKGILYPTELSTLSTLASQYPTSVKYLSLSPAEQKQVVRLFFLPPGPHSFARFLGVFTVISKLMFANKQVDPEPAMEAAFFERAKALNVDYVEISRYIVPRPDWIKSLPQWAQAIDQRYGITARYLASFSRMKDAAFTRGKAEQLLKLPASDYLVGVNLLNDEGGFPALEFGQTLYVPLLAANIAGSSQLHRSMHAGELGDERNVRDAMIMGAERIGHGVTFATDPVSVEYARLRQLPVEVNLVSNLRLKVVPDLKSHPFLRLLRLGLPVSLSTDDEGIFESDIGTECETAVAGSNVTYSELQDMARHGIRTAFVDDATKTKLLKNLEVKFGVFEKQWSQLQP